MVRDLKPLPASLKAPRPDLIVSCVRDEEMVTDYLTIEAGVWPGEPSITKEFLRSTFSDPLNLNPAFIAYLNGAPIGCARATTSGKQSICRALGRMRFA
jgi:hypothetical protein